MNLNTLPNFSIRFHEFLESHFANFLIQRITLINTKYNCTVNLIEVLFNSTSPQPSPKERELDFTILDTLSK